MRVNSGSFTTAPQQQITHVYSVTWPYIEVQYDQITGTIPALLKLIAHGKNLSFRSANRFYMGSRSMFRGENFTAILNAADEQNPSGVTVDVDSPAVFETSSLSATGRRVNHTPSANSLIVTGKH